jgi:phosphoribosylformimino-5-aminoimidazole carboxamide ribotide isomerase
MVIFPAIDIIGGNVVRLFQGDYSKQQTFGDNPADFALRFYTAGARHLHLVDLDGAKAGVLQNFETARAIKAAVPDMFIELGGGIRSEAAVENCFEAGIDRVILGTSALKDPRFTQKMVAEYGGKIAVGIDARDGKVAIDGWLATSDTDSVSFCKEMRNTGVRHIIYTDISRDGAGQGANLEIYKTLAEIEGIDITASGGVTSLGDVAALCGIGLYAAIIGKALYTGAIDLTDAIMTAESKT